MLAACSLGFFFQLLVLFRPCGGDSLDEGDQVPDAGRLPHLLGVKRTWLRLGEMSASDPKRTFSRVAGCGRYSSSNDRQRGKVATTAPTIGPLFADRIFSKVHTDIERQYSP
jgi:hypothetical protein